MNIYDFSNYKKFVHSWLSNQPKKGHGYFAKIAEALEVSAVMVSQIFNGNKNLSLEHAYLLTEFMSLNSDEKNYFILLVNYERAGSFKLREHFKKEIQAIQRKKTEDLKTIVVQDISLNDADKAVFYSSWLYSAIRLQTSIYGFQSVDSLSTRFQISRDEVLKILQFLVDKNLCVQTRRGYEMGPQRTHLESDSPYVRSRQVSWRVKGFEKMEMPKKNFLFYTAPMSISEDLFSELRKRLVETIAELGTKIADEKHTPQKLACLNIDLFDV